MNNTAILRLLIIVTLCFLIYGPSLSNGFIWDDDAYVHKNTVLTSPSALQDIWFSYKTPQYYPLVFTSFWIEHKLWDFKPFGYHLINLILHILNALLVFSLVKRLCPRLALFVTLIFALHPIQVETVAWITERKNLLGLLFFLLTTLSYLRFEQTKKKIHYINTIILFACALLSKSVAVCFVALPLLYEWWKENRITLQKMVLTLPFAAIGALSAINTIYLELYRVGARGDSWTLSFLERFILSGRILLFYIYKILLPFKSIFFYPRWEINTSQWWQWIFIVIAAFALGLLLKYRRRIGRGAAALFIFYIISIFPALGFLNVYPMKYSYVADHFSYLSTPALILLLSAALSLIRMPKLLTRFLLIALIIFLGAKSMALTSSYKDEITLWEDTIQKNPAAWMAYNNLGLVYKDSGKKEQALKLLTKAVEIKPDYAEGFNNLGITYRALGQNNQAIAFYEKALELSPLYANAHNNLGIVLKDKGKIDQAVASYKRAIEIYPGFSQAYSNLGVAYKDSDDIEKAVTSYLKAIALDPAQAKFYNNLGLAYSDGGRKDQAITSFNKALELDPAYAEAYNNLGITYQELNKPQDAVFSYKKALDIDPGYVYAYNNLGITYARMGKTRQAISLFKKAAEISPGYSDAYFNLGNALSDLGKTREAEAAYDQARKLKGRP